MEKEIIKLKGTIDGVKIYLDADCSVSDITASLYEKLRQFRSFFGDGHCNIYFVGRELTASDKMRLEAIVSAMLPESAINYGERKRVKNDDYKERTLKLPEDLAAFEKTDTNDGDKPFDDELQIEPRTLLRGHCTRRENARVRRTPCARRRR